MEQARISSHGAAQGQQAASAAQAASSKGTGKPASTPDAATGAGGFLALLASLGEASEGLVMGEGDSGEPVGGALLAADALVPGEATDTALATADDPAVAAWQGLFGVAPEVLPTAPSTPGVAVSTFAEASALGGRGNLPTGGDAWLVPDAAGLSSGLVAQTTALDLAGDNRTGPLAGSGVGLSRTAPKASSALTRILEDVQSGRQGPGAGVHGAGRGATQDGNLPLVGAWQAVAQNMAPAREMQGLSLLPHPSGTHQDNRLGDGDMASLLAMTDPGATGAEGQTAGDKPSGGADFSASASSNDAMTAGPVEPGSQDGVLTFDEAVATALTPEERIAEQVTYWVNQKIQSAEMTLTADGQPVEVLVTLSGNEAHVAFRSDESQTRELLDAGAQQLSDLLRGEGLVLSGMTVGTSARDGSAPGREGSSPRREGERQVRVQAFAPVAHGAATAASGRVGERSVDVYA